ncbi:MAG: response regulator [Candidatus Magnetomorum sp.]|nr:response regulator [Candidatus Magnetomorum sp.]
MMIFEKTLRRIIKNRSIRSKIMLAVVSTSTISVIFAALSFIFLEFHIFHKATCEFLSTIAESVSMNCEAPLYFGDADAAHARLQSLTVAKDVIAACIMETPGQLFARYHKKDQNPNDPDLFSRAILAENFEESLSINRLRLHLFKPIQMKKKCIGMLYVQVDLTHLIFLCLMCLGFAFGVIGIAFFISIFLSRRYMEVITDPILHLVEVAQSISQNKNYSVRATKCDDDELGGLIETFNSMIHEIHVRDQALEIHKNHLEEKVSMRTAELLDLNKDLEQARKQADDANHAKSEFLANMSHEIRTPMNAILGFTELLQKKMTDEQQKRWLQSISSSGKTLLSLINDILDLSKIEAGKMTLDLMPVNPRSIFSDIINIFKAKCEKKQVAFETEVAKNLNESLILDETRLRQILFNIVGNAVKFTEEGFIKLSVHQQYSKPDRSALDLIFAVEDTGTGIPESQQKLIFEAFRQQDGQSHAKFGGTGLGLAITRRLVEMMGGEIQLSSQPGKGSVFSILLKDVDVASVLPKISKPVLQLADVQFKPATILSVDDIETNRILLRDFLSPYSFDIYDAENGQRALEMARKVRPQLIFMDMKMPIMNGYEATQRIKADPELSSIPVIALTASVMKENLHEIEDAGCNDLLQKPVGSEDVIRILMKYIDHTIADDDSTKSVGNDDAQVISDQQKQDVDPQKMNALIEQLKGDLYTTWEQTSQQFIFTDIESFGETMIHLGKEYMVNMVASWGKKLISQAKNFDMEMLPETLAAYPDLIKILEKKE